MNLILEEVNSISIAILTCCDLDAENSDQFMKEIDPYLVERSKIVLDLRTLQFVDSSGLGALLSCNRKLQNVGGALVLCCLTEPVREIVELVRFHKILNIRPSREEAIHELT